MGKRYYCEYCDRSFKDTTTSRKNHLKSLAHQQTKKAWYDSFKDKRTKLTEELTKRPCNTYMLKGTCPFGNQCRYRHLTEQEVHEIKSEVGKQNNEQVLNENLTVENWLKNRTFITDAKTVTSATNSDVSTVSARLPSNFPKELTYLPPSLQPNPHNVIVDSTSVQWG